MTFLAPFLLWGSLAASIPIVLHFFYRSRYRDVPWAAMKFLLAAIEQTSRRLRFQELLLLLLRVFLLLLLAFALSRPSSSTVGQGARGDAVDAVLIIDQSMSMSARSGIAPLGGDVYQSALREFATKDNSVTCFDRARAAALSVLSHLPPDSTVQVIVCSDRATTLGPRDPSHLDQARKLVGDLTITALGTDFAEAFRLAGEALKSGPSPNKEVYLFSDLQRQGFEARSSALEKSLAELTEKATVTFVQCAPGETGNAAILGLTQQTTILTGERAEFALVVKNTGKKPLNNLVANLVIDDKVRDADKQVVGDLGPGETRAVFLTAQIEKAGRHVLRATIGPDDLEGDNTLDQVINANDKVGALLVDGAPNPSDPALAGSFFLKIALNPIAPNATLPVTALGAGRVAPADLADKKLCILVNTQLERQLFRDQELLAPEFVRALASFVQSGNSLMIFAGDRVVPEQYNRLLFEQERLLPYRIASIQSDPRKVKAMKEPWLFDRTTALDPPYGRFQKEQVYSGMEGVKTFRRCLLDEKHEGLAELAEESRVLLRYNDGAPAIASRRRLGQGEVVFITTSVAADDWSNLPVWPPTFVPLMQITVKHLLEGGGQDVNRVAGEPLVATVPTADAEVPYDVIYPDGRRERLGTPVTEKGRSVVTAPNTPVTGLYKLAPADRDPGDTAPLFAVTADLRETEDLESLPQKEISERYGDKVRLLTASDDGEVFSGAERLKREWTMWLLAALLVLVLCEMALAWHCGRSW